MKCSNCGTDMGANIVIDDRGVTRVPVCIHCNVVAKPAPTPKPRPKEWHIPPRVRAASAVLKEIGLAEEADMFVRWARGHDPRGGHCSCCGEVGGHKPHCPLGKILATEVRIEVEPPTSEEIETLRTVAAQHVDFELCTKDPS